MIPRPKSRNCSLRLHCLTAMATSRLEMTSAATAKTSGTLSTAPSTYATVRFEVRKEATMPTASMASPTSQ